MPKRRQAGRTPYASRCSTVLLGADFFIEPSAGVAVFLVPYGVGVATSSTPLLAVSVAQKNTCPRSLFIAPEFGVIKGSGWKTFGPVTRPKIVPTPGMTCQFEPPSGERRLTTRTSRYPD